MGCFQVCPCQAQPCSGGCLPGCQHFVDTCSLHPSAVQLGQVVPCRVCQPLCSLGSEFIFSRPGVCVVEGIELRAVPLSYIHSLIYLFGNGLATLLNCPDCIRICSPALVSLSAGITRLCHHAWLMDQFFHQPAHHKGAGHCGSGQHRVRPWVEGKETGFWGQAGLGLTRS